MRKKEPRDTLEVAMLPLQDGRQIVVPLQVLVEVQQIQFGAKAEAESAELTELSWRGRELPIDSLDTLCGLPAPAREQMSTVGIFKADKDAEHPFRALSFCGNAAHRRIDAASLEPADTPADGHFVGAMRMEEQLYLIPDLPKLLFTGS